MEYKIVIWNPYNRIMNFRTKKRITLRSYQDHLFVSTVEVIFRTVLDGFSWGFQQFWTISHVYVDCWRKKAVQEFEDHYKQKVVIESYKERSKILIRREDNLVIFQAQKESNDVTTQKGSSIRPAIMNGWIGYVKLLGVGHSADFVLTLPRNFFYIFLLTYTTMIKK